MPGRFVNDFDMRHRWTDNRGPAFKVGRKKDDRRGYGIWVTARTGGLKEAIHGTEVHSTPTVSLRPGDTIWEHLAEGVYDFDVSLWKVRVQQVRRLWDGYVFGPITEKWVPNELIPMSVKTDLVRGHNKGANYVRNREREEWWSSVGRTRKGPGGRRTGR